MSKKNNVALKTELCAGLIDVRERLLALAASLDSSGRSEVYLGTWSVKELLAHLAGWDETNIQAMDEILSGTAPSFYRYSDKDWATYNAMLVSKYAKNRFEELLSLVRETHTKLLGRIERTSADELWEDRGIRVKGWKVTIGRLLNAELQDEEEHYSQLLKFIEEGVKS